MSANVELIKLTGGKLLRGDTIVDASEELKDCKAVAFYFSAHWCPPCRGFTPKLAEWYKKDLKGKGLEVVFVSSDRDETAFKEYFAEQPWLSLPFELRDKKNELSKLYKVSGIPSLVIVDNAGEIITIDGRSAVSEDPTGENFPWRPLPLEKLIGTEFVKLNSTDKKTLETVGLEQIKNKKLGFYMSAHWCGPCRTFTPQLTKIYETLKRDDFEIVFISLDRDEESFKSYLGEMGNWLAVPFGDKKRAELLKSHFECQGIPHFVMVDAEDPVTGKREVINNNCRGQVGNDLEGKNFPWAKLSVRDVNQDPEGIDEMPSLVVCMEKGFSKDIQEEKVEKILKVVADEKKYKQKFNFFVACESEGLSERVREECSLGDCEEGKMSIVLMDIEDKGAYYAFEGELTVENVVTFLDDYENKNLTRKQMN